MRLFSQLGWYFLSEWRRYLGAVCFLIIIAILQLVPPRIVGVVVDGISKGINHLCFNHAVDCIGCVWVAVYLAFMVIWCFL